MDIARETQAQAQVEVLRGPLSLREIGLPGPLQVAAVAQVAMVGQPAAAIAAAAGSQDLSSAMGSVGMQLTAEGMQ